METTTSRIWDPHAPSILWAHEIRRENIHLVNQLDNLRGQVDGLHAWTRGADTRHDNMDTRMSGIEEKIEVRLGVLSERVEALVKEHSLFKERIGIVEEGKKTQDWELCQLKESIQNMVVEEVQGCFARECDALLGKDGVVDALEAKQTSPGPDIVFDSMHNVASATRSLQRNFPRSLSETTWGSSNQSQESLNRSFDCRGDFFALGATQHPQIKQDGRSLEGYLSHVERVRAQLPPRKKEGQIVEGFVRGLDDPEMRRFFEGQMDRTGWSWDALAIIVHESEKQRAQTLVQQQQVKLENIKDRGTVEAAVGSAKPKKAKRQRRFIPIVPIDEEDLV